MPTISRTLQPSLPDFLYALSKSDGADPFLGAPLRRRPGAQRRALRRARPRAAARRAWHEQTGPPFNPMPENLGGVGIDIKKTANILPLGSPATAYSAASNLPAGAACSRPGTVHLPSGINTPSSAAPCRSSSSAPRAPRVTYRFSEGAIHVTGAGVIGSSGTSPPNLDSDRLPRRDHHGHRPDTSGGTTTTLTCDDEQEHLDPADAHGRRRPAREPANATAFNVTVTGQVGSIANVTITDGANAGVATAMTSSAPTAA